MFATTFYLDSPMSLDRLAEAFATATDTSREQVATITRADFERSPRRWFSNGQAVGLQVREEHGDFPFAVEFLAREHVTFPTVIGWIARELGVTALTDKFGVDPSSDSMWTMVTPEGATTTVFVDNADAGDDEPDLVLDSASRVICESQRRSPTIAYF